MTRKTLRGVLRVMATRDVALLVGAAACIAVCMFSPPCPAAPKSSQAETSAARAGFEVQAPFSDFYVAADLGPVPELPLPVGGLTFLPGDPDTLLIAGSVLRSSSGVYSIGVERDFAGHITGFSGRPAHFADTGYADGDMEYGPSGVLFLGCYETNQLMQVKPGSAVADKVIGMGPFGVAYGACGLAFVPDGFPGEGQFKVVSWDGGEWYTVSLAPDRTGTFDVTSATLETQIEGGPVGLVYVPPGYPLFPDLASVLVCGFLGREISAYEVDTNGDPVPGTRRLFMAGAASGVEGAEVDPLTGDFVFSTFHDGNVSVVRRITSSPLKIWRDDGRSLRLPGSELDGAAD